MWIIRWVMVAISAAIAVVLIGRGNVILGSLVGALAVTRLVMLVTVTRRRRVFRRRVRRRLGDRL